MLVPGRHCCCSSEEIQQQSNSSEIAEDQFHTLVALEADSVIF